MSDPRDSAAHGGPSAPALGSTVDGRYTIVGRVGAGGMAVVYRAREEGLFSREVALKVLSTTATPVPSLVQRFLLEAQAIAEVRHPNVVSLFHAGRTAEGQPYLAMELLSGATLSAEFAALAARGEAFTWERLGPIALQICAALQAAHRRGIIHRDIKPGNCFLVHDEDGGPEFVKVLDFGIAKVLPLPTDAPRGEVPLTQEGMFLGTPHYAAPEVVEPSEDRPIDGRADQFALGVVLYQMLTGTLPFAGLPQVLVLDKTARETPPSPRARAPGREIPPAVDALIMRAMALEPRDRFPSMAALAEAIRATLGPVVPARTASGRIAPPAADEATPPPSAVIAAESRTIVAARGRRTRGLIGATGVMVVAVLAVAVGVGRQLGGEDGAAARAASGDARAAGDAAGPAGDAGAGARAAAGGAEGLDAAGAAANDAGAAAANDVEAAANDAGAAANDAGAAAANEVEAAANEVEAAPGSEGEGVADGDAAKDDDEVLLLLDDAPGEGPRPGSRARRIARELRALGRDAKVHACLSKHVPMGVGVKTVLTGAATVSARGAVTLATIDAPQQGPTLPASVRLCVERRVERARVTAGPEPRLVVPFRLEVE